MTITENLNLIRNQLPAGVRLVAISKTKSTEEILELYHRGQITFGENKIQEMLPKYEILPKDISWHMVGHLQTNKVKYIAPFIGMIHSVDSLKLLKVIDKEARKNKRTIPCLLEMHIAEEETKYGLSFQEACELLDSESSRQLQHVDICGLMGMATFTEDEKQIRKEFRTLAHYFKEIKNTFFQQKEGFCELSMGMSDDFEIGIQEGSTMVRIGSAIFGSR